VPDHDGPGRITRREFIRTGATAATIAAGACVTPRSEITRKRGVCHHDCPDSCAWIISTSEGEALSIEGDSGHPFTNGELCDKMTGFLTDVVYNPDRLLYPLKRVGMKGAAEFERIGWDEALDDVAARLSATIEQQGGEAVLPYNFAGTMGVAQGWSLDQRFFARLGASRLEHTICGATAAAGLTATMGTDTGLLQQQMVDSRFIVMWGGNPVVTNPHGWRSISEARAAGAQLVVVDPLRSATAEEADWHVRPRPGTDTALALGLMQVIVRTGLHDRDYVERYTLGFERLAERLNEYPPERVAQITGVAAKEIIELARVYATTRPAAIQLHIGLEKHFQGGMTYRTIACLPAIIGAWRDPGGGLMYSTNGLFGRAINWGAMGSIPDAPETRSISMSQVGRALTDTALEPPIQALVVYNANPATIAPNQNLVRQGLEREDLFTVVLDHFVTDTARYADYVFPATTQAEHLDLVVPYGTPYLALNTPAIDPLGEARTNTDFFRALALRLGFDEPYLYASDEALVRQALAVDDPLMNGISFERLEHEGWARLNVPESSLPFAAGGFPTTSGKCELYSDDLAARGLDPLPGYVEEVRSAEDSGRHPLRFMSPKWNPYFVNSSHANQPRLERAAGTPRLRIHPDDAAARGIGDGDIVRVFNDRGTIALAAEVTDAMQVNVVAMLHGWWASRIGGSSANALTHDELADFGGGSAMHDCHVEVVRA
jgi:anaerobic selenocysteine-containing dehydrogenase